MHLSANESHEIHMKRGGVGEKASLTKQPSWLYRPPRTFEPSCVFSQLKFAIAFRSLNFSPIPHSINISIALLSY